MSADQQQQQQHHATEKNEPSVEYISMEEGSVSSASAAHNDASSSLKTEKQHLCSELLHFFHHRPWHKKLLTMSVIVSCIYVFIDLVFLGYIEDLLEEYIDWMERHIAAGVFAFIGIFIVSTLIFIPPTILTVGCGFIFGKVCGLFLGIIAATAACFIGSVIGATIAFFRARYMMRDLVKLFARRYPVVKAVDRAISRHGFRVMLLLRLCPIIPFNALSYIGGILGIPWDSYVYALVGILPMQIMTVSIGATAGTMTTMTHDENQEVLRCVLISSGLAFGLIAVAITYHFAKKELKKELQRENSIQNGLEVTLSGDSNSSDDTWKENEGVEISYKKGIDDEEWFWVLVLS
mmetsp:Transcript_13100/g.23738  ORF Transcript_13100/g.23738 Transcript_13100/m.23738 type:complete len:350 (-) Transcript_13100:413-1462(-)